MDITGKINLFVRKVEGYGNVFNTSISKKREDGSYCQKYVDVIFSKDVAPKEKLDAMKEEFVYSVEITKGFLSLHEYFSQKENKNIATFVICVTEGKVTGRKEISKTNKKSKEKENDALPF